MGPESRPISLMEQKKQQWAREKEELNGLWSPWGRPQSRSGLPTHNPVRCSNKLTNSTLQSECLLPPILGQNNNNNSHRDDATGHSVHWANGENGNKRQTPICINAATGQVHLNNKCQEGVNFQVNNAVVISSDNFNNNALSTTRILHDKGIKGKKMTYHSHTGQQAKGTGGDKVEGSWSSFDEETFTSGYQSESNGFLSNGEDAGYQSRNGSGDNTKQVQQQRRTRMDWAKGPEGKQQLSPKSSSRRSEFRSEERLTVVSGPGGKFSMATDTTSSEEVGRKLGHQQQQPHQDQPVTSRSTGNLSSLFNEGPHDKRLGSRGPPPPAMRSSIAVGVDPALDADSLRQLQRMEREKWLQELEKQREEQRLRKQMEKDEKRPKWGDKGIGVGHFWEPSTSESDHLPPSRGEESAVMTAPSWLEKRIQSSVSQPSLNELGTQQQQQQEQQPMGRAQTNQSSVDLRNVSGMADSPVNSSRTYLRGHNVPADPEVVVEKEKKRQAAMEHQEAIRKQIEERQMRLKEEKEKRLQEDLADEEKLKMQRLRELERLELEARKLGRMGYQSDQEGEEMSLVDLPEPEPPKFENPSGRTSSSELRRLSLDEQSLMDEPMYSMNSVNSKMGMHSQMTSSQSMMELSEPKTPVRREKKQVQEPPVQQQQQQQQQEQQQWRGQVKPKQQQDQSKATNFNGRRSKKDKNEPSDLINGGTLSQRSRSLNRDFATQMMMDHDEDATPSPSRHHHRSYNSLVDKQGGGSSKSKSSAGEEEILARQKHQQQKAEKPRWGATQNKKQYLKQSEKDPMYQQRLKRRMDRIKKFEDQLNSMTMEDYFNMGSRKRNKLLSNIALETDSDNFITERGGGKVAHLRLKPKNVSEKQLRREAAHHQEAPTVVNSRGSRTVSKNQAPRGPERHARSPHQNGQLQQQQPKQQKEVRRGPMKADHRINLGRQDQDQNMEEAEKNPVFKVKPKAFSDPLGVSPFKPSPTDFDPQLLHDRAESNFSSGFSSPSMESVMTHRSTVSSHYYSQRERVDGGSRTVEVDMAGHYASARSVQVRYEENGRSFENQTQTKTTQSPMTSSSRKKMVNTSSNEVTFKKTFTEQGSASSLKSAPPPPSDLEAEELPEASSRNRKHHQSKTDGHQQRIQSYQSRATGKQSSGGSNQVKASTESLRQSKNARGESLNASKVGETYEEFRQLTPSFSFEDTVSIPANISMADFDEIPVGIPSKQLNEFLVKASPRPESTIIAAAAEVPPPEPVVVVVPSKVTVPELSPVVAPKPASTVPTPLPSTRSSVGVETPQTFAEDQQQDQTCPSSKSTPRLSSPPVPAVLRKLQAGIPIEDLAVCDDLLYEIPRTNASVSTSNGYKSVESDSSNTPPEEKPVSKQGPVVAAHSKQAKPKVKEAQGKLVPLKALPKESLPLAVLKQADCGSDLGKEDRNKRKHVATKVSSDSFDGEDEDDFEELQVLRTSRTPRSKSTLDHVTDVPWKPLSSIYDADHELYNEEPLYPYPAQKASSKMVRTQHQSTTSSPRKAISSLRPQLSPEQTAVEIRAGYRSFRVSSEPDYEDYEADKGLLRSAQTQHYGVGGAGEAKVLSSSRLQRPGTQDTDLSNRERLISYVLNNKDVQAQISARDSELSEKGIIEFNVRLPSNLEKEYRNKDSSASSHMPPPSRSDDYGQYKDPLLSERQRATLRWLHSSGSSSSTNHRDSVLTHLSHLKKGIAQQQQEWNLIPSDTSDTEDDRGISRSHRKPYGNVRSGSSTDSSSRS